ncbi:hypothetical protein GFK21_20570, partial [Salmonella enterica subsp. enterica serovar Enteritidis]|nr:hypothetical protein [Salmonella enterica subsp. enterica serovar Enteritidis]
SPARSANSLRARKLPALVGLTAAPAWRNPVRGGFWSGTDIIIPGQLNQHRYRNVLTQERLMPGERLSLASHQGGVLVLMSD